MLLFLILYDGINCQGCKDKKVSFFRKLKIVAGVFRLEALVFEKSTFKLRATQLSFKIAKIKKRSTIFTVDLFSSNN
jgi:hypothetical protein